MRNYALGNRLRSFRERAGLPQWKLARMAGVTDKAVSKWENGAALPSSDRLRMLAGIFGTSVDDLLELKGAKAMDIRKIVITGGPCAGKTTALSWAANAMSARGWRVLCVPETATELITGGAAPWLFPRNQDYQKCQMKLQEAKESVFTQAAAGLGAEKVLVICDRGMMDNLAYMDDAEFEAVASFLGKTRTELRDGYDAVFDLVTAADGAEEHYTLENNAARTEGLQKARELDAAVRAAWTGHPHLRVVGNGGTFEDKMTRLVREIASFLGEPEPMEHERKFLIKLDSPKALLDLPSCVPVEIVQTYLEPEDGDEVRVRQRGSRGSYLYYLTRKHRTAAGSAYETERQLPKDEYLDLLMRADTSRRPIRKTRYCVAHDGTYYEIDVYPDRPGEAVLEVELSSPDDPVAIPDMFQVVREVTGDPAYLNYNMAKLP